MMYTLWQQAVAKLHEDVAKHGDDSREAKQARKDERAAYMRVQRGY